MSSLIEQEDTQSVDDGFTNRTYVVSNHYEATFVDDLSVQFAQTVKILRDNNDDWLYVQVSTARGGSSSGYVPRTIVIDLKKFVQQLKEQQYNILNSDSHKTVSA